MEMTKKSILIPRSVVKTAEQLANRLGMSLNEFYTAALSAYIEDCKKDSLTTEKLNQIYKTECSSMDPELVKMQVRSLGDETW